MIGRWLDPRGMEIATKQTIVLSWCSISSVYFNESFVLSADKKSTWTLLRQSNYYKIYQHLLLKLQGIWFDQGFL